MFLVDDDEKRPLEERAVARESRAQPREESHDEAITRLFGDEVSSALQRVPTDFRMAVVLVDVYDFSYKEAAEILGCPIGTVMSRLYRGRRLLRSELAEYAVEAGVGRNISDGYQEQIESDRAKMSISVAFGSQANASDCRDSLGVAASRHSSPIFVGPVQPCYAFGLPSHLAGCSRSFVANHLRPLLNEPRWRHR